ncbi:MarR family winged helix-turn-helix transcriptional regulator [Solimonas sp. SE-A11]|uniref:MarR family winged helix-turn-helix transcriptional regulator n=1 Tax=Solimonas sp. SE-A11 TaxID=3054954 RepID=UPI00259C760E|nr:MarR family transcriptional regulator [Solimonas sp. SE-A11]MDM4769471.1 MarR family transcriptional regulator [Solimonas sp. SE-A11]
MSLPSPAPRPLFSDLLPAEFKGNLSFLLARTRQDLAEEMDAVFAEEGLGIRHYAILSLLFRKGGLRQTDIAAVMSLDRTTTMKVVDELESRGLLQRSRHSEDRRANAIDLTDAGRAWRERYMARVLEQEQRFLSSLSPGERTLLQELLLKLVAGVHQRRNPDEDMNTHEG